MPVVVADLEARPRLGRNDIDGLVANIDRGELEVRGIEMRAAGIERIGGKRAHQRDDAAHRIVSQRRIGDVPGGAGHDQRSVLRAAPADLDHVTERVRVGRLSEDAVVEFFAADRKSTRLNSSHVEISYAVFCLKKKTPQTEY